MIQFLAVARDFALFRSVQPGSVAHSASYAIVKRNCSSGELRLACEVVQSPPSTAKAKNQWRYTSASPYAFIACKVTTSECYKNATCLCVKESDLSILSLFLSVIFYPFCPSFSICFFFFLPASFFRYIYLSSILFPLYYIFCLSFLPRFFLIFQFSSSNVLLLSFLKVTVFSDMTPCSLFQGTNFSFYFKFPQKVAEESTFSQAITVTLYSREVPFSNLWGF